MVIITIQHPESIHHTNGMIGSWTDWELTEKGIVQAENIARNIRKEFQDIQYAIYSSPLKRTMQAAEILGKELHSTPKHPHFKKERFEWGWNNLLGENLKQLLENSKI